MPYTRVCKRRPLPLSQSICVISQAMNQSNIINVTFNCKLCWRPCHCARAVHCAIRRQLAQQGAGSAAAGSGGGAFGETTGLAAAAAAAPMVTADDLNEALRGFVPAPFWGVQQAAAAAGKVHVLGSTLKAASATSGPSTHSHIPSMVPRSAAALLYTLLNHPYVHRCPRTWYWPAGAALPPSCAGSPLPSRLLSHRNPCMLCFGPGGVVIRCVRYLRRLVSPIPTQADGWEDVGGLQHVVAALREALLLPVRYRRLVAGAPLRLRTGALLYGPPGCGKTHVVSAAVAAVAKVANVR